jgi:hypothetical protein
MPRQTSPAAARENTFRYRPWTVPEPFDQVAVRHYPISRLVQDAGCRWIRGELGWVNRAAHVAYTRGGDEVSYDAVVLALGGRELLAPPAILSFSERTAKDYQTALESAVAERVDSIGYVALASPCWPLPLYELAWLAGCVSPCRRHRRSLPGIVVTTKLER